MFIIECRLTMNGVSGGWFPIWKSEDGADTASYLQRLTIHHSAHGEGTREYRMTYDVTSK